MSMTRFDLCFRALSHYPFFNVAVRSLYFALLMALPTYCAFLPCSHSRIEGNVLSMLGMRECTLANLSKRLGGKEIRSLCQLAGLR